jgi:hypothetical protein
LAMTTWTEELHSGAIPGDDRLKGDLPWPLAHKNTDSPQGENHT